MFSFSGNGLIQLVTVKATASVHALPFCSIKKYAMKNTKENIKNKRENTKENVKFYKINKTFYELRDFNTTESIINFIVKKHKEKSNGFEEFEEFEETEVEEKLPCFEIEFLKYYLYVFSQNTKSSSWKDFLPVELTKNSNFLTREASFVLFITNEVDIYTIIGGRGIQVIKRFLNPTFGIDVFARIAEPEINLVQSVKSRGVTGNIAGSSIFYRNEHKLIDTISFGNIHTEINFEFREETVVDVFDFLDYDEHKSVYGLAGTAFAIKVKLTFEKVHKLIKRIIEIEKIKVFKPLSSFIQINDKKNINSQIRPKLFRILREDLIKIFEPKSASIFKFDFDFCHPSKMATFYECDTYKVFEKGAHKPFLTLTERQDIYKETMGYIYGNVNYPELRDFMSFLGGVMVKGFKQGEKKTTAPFPAHISCEIEINKVPYFCIDNKWYKVRGTFIDEIDDTCQRLMRSNQADIDILPKNWENPQYVDESDYNLLYKDEKNYIVLDKILGDNIELCDIVFETENKLYLIHVKKGFDAKIRDLTNQIIISSKRLWDDLKSKKMSFLDSIYNRYSKSDNVSSNGIKTKKEFKEMFQKDIIYIFAFVSGRKDSIRVIDDISKIRSNIAKYSMINCVKSMKENSYPLQIVEIER